MKNIYLLPTDKPSRLFLNKVNNKLLLEDISNPSLKKVLPSESYQNIYITNDEKPKDGDWCLSFLNGIVDTITDQQGVYKVKNGDSYYEDKKIILTKDPDLIADGIQAIDDEFLEWFIKNSNVKFVEVEPDYEEIKGDYYKIISSQEESKQKYIGECNGNNGNGCFLDNPGHDCGCFVKVLIEKSEQEICNFCGKTLREQMKGCNEITCYRQFIPKETIEELAEKYSNKKGDIPTTDLEDAIFKQGFIDGAKLVGERSYSDLTKLRNELYNQLPTDNIDAFELIKIIKTHIQKLDELCKTIKRNKL
jgi:hypothetical protein